MPEKFLGINPERKQFDKDDEYYALLWRAKQGVDKLSRQDRERLVEFGHHYLDDDLDDEKTHTTLGVPLKQLKILKDCVS